jgi:hypothetical protein
MLNRRQIALIAETMYARLGEVAVAAAMLRAQRAASRGDDAKAATWRRIAETIHGGHQAHPA